MSRGSAVAAILAAAAAVGAGALGGCETPPLKIAFQVSGGPVQACPAAAMSTSPTCADVPMLCDAVLNIRIVRPSNPQETYLPLCEEVPFDRDRDLCSIASIDLPASKLPKEMLEIQVMIWPRDAVKEDPDTRALDCREIYGQPVLIGFGVNGFPEETTPAPALGGRAYYYPGDDQTVVTLGCSNLPSVNQPACFGAGGIEVSATVNEFDRPLRSVPRSMVNDLNVSVGEPRSDDGAEYRLEATTGLDPVALEPGEEPRWEASIPGLVETICLQVIGTAGANVATVRCGRVSPTRRLDVTGYWLRPELMLEILAGVGLGRVPPQGLTIGMVLDPQGRPAGGYEVNTNTGATVKYLDAANAELPGATATSSTGIFVSEDAPYDTTFMAKDDIRSLRAEGLGGLVKGRVTIVLLQLASPSAPTG